jgi:hypothetical protein
MGWGYKLGRCGRLSGDSGGSRSRDDVALSEVAKQFDISHQVDVFKQTIGELQIYAANLLALVEYHNITLADVPEELGLASKFNDLLMDMKEAFPSPDQAPSREQTQEAASMMLAKAEDAILDVVGNTGLSEKHLDESRLMLREAGTLIEGASVSVCEYQIVKYGSKRSELNQGSGSRRAAPIPLWRSTASCEGQNT